jgi:uncharacterized protein YraI
MKTLLVLFSLALPVMADAQIASGKFAQTYYATTGVRLRAEPTTESRVLTTISQGAKIQVGSCAFAGGEWCEVEYVGLEGYAALRLISTQFVARDTTINVTRAKFNSSSSGSSASSSRRSSAAARGYHRGPRGGCYTYSASGRKRYVDRSLCN